jgi:tripartite-type tricarboxylate transporter receptor subunit TctC
MRRLLYVAAVVVGILTPIAPALAQDWPTRPVTMIVPFAAGGLPIRSDGSWLHAFPSFWASRSSSKTSAAPAATGSARVAKAAPDGYQLVLGNVGTHAANQTFYKAPLYNAATDFAPIMLTWSFPSVLVVPASLPVKSALDLFALAKTKPDGLNYASSGGHLLGSMLAKALHLPMTHVPYKGAGQAMPDVVAGRVDYKCPTRRSPSKIESKTVKAIAILTRDRSPIPARPCHRP